MGLIHRHLSPSIFACGTVCLAATGCVGGAQLVLKSPIEDQCVSAGLNGCDSIAEGATLYADGNAKEGEHKLRRGLHANADKIAELKKFADGLALVSKIPGAGQYIGLLQPAILLVQQTAEEAEARQPRPVEPAPEPADAKKRLTGAEARQENVQMLQKPELSEQPPPPEPQPVPISTFWMVAGNTLASSCRFAGISRMQCLHDVIDSPKVVTDVIVSAACPVDVMVASRVALNFDWLVYAPAGKGVQAHGASLPLEPKHSFTVATAQKGDDVPLDIRCGVTTVWHAVQGTALTNTPARADALKASRAGTAGAPYQDR
jgi:hypothetical protein